MNEHYSSQIRCRLSVAWRRGSLTCIMYASLCWMLLVQFRGMQLISQSIVFTFVNISVYLIRPNACQCRNFSKRTKNFPTQRLLCVDQRLSRRYLSVLITLYLCSSLAIQIIHRGCYELNRLLFSYMVLILKIAWCAYGPGPIWKPLGWYYSNGN